MHTIICLELSMSLLFQPKHSHGIIISLVLDTGYICVYECPANRWPINSLFLATTIVICLAWSWKYKAIEKLDQYKVLCYYGVCLLYLCTSLLFNSITLIFFAKETEDCNLIATRESLKPVTVDFHQGLGQKFRQPSGTGVDSSLLDEMDVGKNGNVEIYPLVVKAEACPLSATETGSSSARNSQITQAMIEKVKDEYKARVVKQILWVNGMRYELQEIYGIGNAVEGDFDGNDSGKECVICLSEPRDTTVLPCRHMV